jgi:hypothetical protein
MRGERIVAAAAQLFGQAWAQRAADARIEFSPGFGPHTEELLPLTRQTASVLSGGNIINRWDPESGHFNLDERRTFELGFSNCVWAALDRTGV